MAIDADVPDTVDVDGIQIEALRLTTDEAPEIAVRYLGDAESGVYLMRPDQHVAARWVEYDEAAVIAALNTATGRL